MVATKGITRDAAGMRFGVWITTRKTQLLFDLIRSVTPRLFGNEWAELRNEGRHMYGRHTPDAFVYDLPVFMSENVPLPNNRRPRNAGERVAALLGNVPGGFADDFDLPLDRRSKQEVALILLECLAFHELNHRPGRREQVGEVNRDVFGRLTRHRAPAY